MAATVAILGVVSWYPQEHAETLFVAKAVLGLISVLLLVFHLNQDWKKLIKSGTQGQRMRYITLLAYAVLVTGSSAEQIEEGQLVSYRHLGSLAVSLLLITAMLISIHESHKGDKPKDGR